MRARFSLYPASVAGEGSSRASRAGARAARATVKGAARATSKKTAKASRKATPAAPRREAAPRAAPRRDAAPRRESASQREAERSGARALVEQLEILGVEVVFGIPGVHNLAIFDALRSSRIRTIGVRHEQAAAYAADGYARTTGSLGVCITTTGPGAANTAAAMGEARAARSPVLHLSTQSETRILSGKTGRFSLHSSPQQRDLMAAVTRWAASVARAEAIPTMVARAAIEAFAGRRGPVFLEIPFDLLSQPVRWKPADPVTPPSGGPDPAQVERGAALLAAARKPLIWAGGGAISGGAAPILLEVAEQLDAPVITTFSGKGIVPADHPLSVGLPPHQPEATALLKGADALLVVGSDLDAMNTQGWRLPLPRPRVSINVVVEDARRNYASDAIIEADARAGLAALLPLLPSRRRGAGAKRVAKAREGADRSLLADEDFKAPYRFVRAVERALPDDAVVIADMAVGGYWMAGYHRPDAPGRFQYPMGWGTLGYALPAALGAAATGMPTLVVCGDGGLMFAPGELATAVQEKLPVVVLVVNDKGYGMLRFDQRERYGETFAVDLHTPDLCAMAEAFGVPATRATQRDLGKTLSWAFEQRGPALVELRAAFAPPLTTSPRWPLKGQKEARP